MDRQGPARSVVVTGASSGIGEACALRLDSLGFRVFAGVRRPADGEALRARASAWLTPVRVDVTDADSIRAMAAAVAEQHPPAAGARGSGLAGLVNNAGIAVAAPLEFVPLDELRRQLEVNVVGQLAVTQALLPLLRRGRGRIVNIGSIGGRTTLPLLGPYSASKYAMEALTDALRLELKPWGIAVSIVEPGTIRTPIWDRSLAAGDELLDRLPPETLQRYGRLIEAVRRRALASARRGTPPEAVADAVVHALTSPRPRTRYLVGRDARLRLALQQCLPDRVRDRLILSLLRHRQSARG